MGGRLLPAGLARPAPIHALISALLCALLSGCAPWLRAPAGGSAAGDSSGMSATSGDSADAAMARSLPRPPGPEPLDQAGREPFPEARDSIRFDVPVSDTVRAFFRPRPVDSALVGPADSQGDSRLRSDGGWVDGISVRPRPRELPAFVKVLIHRGSKPLPVYSLGEVEIRGDNQGGARPVAPVKARGRLVVRRNGSEYEVSQNGRTVFKSNARRLRLVSLNPYNLLELGGQVYRGHLEIIASPLGELSAVNVLGVEDYLRGVLPYELGTVDRQGLEALKAQAVAARTYVYKRMLASPNGDFHVHSDVQDQVYKGVKAEYLLSDRAIRETRGMALVFRDSLVQCYYHSTCGGRTASRHEVWGGDSAGYLITRPDIDASGASYCQASRYSEWRQEWSLPQLAGILKRNLASANAAGFAPFTKVLRMDVASRAACGRVKLLRITTDAGEILVKGDKVRWALRPAGAEDRILPSAWFDLKVTEGKALAQGRAFGHGIGLCQVGAIARSKAGQDFRTIMAAYYNGADIAEFR